VPSVAYTGSGFFNPATAGYTLPTTFTPTVTGIYICFCGVLFTPIGGQATIFGASDSLSPSVADVPNAFTVFGNSIPLTSPSPATTGGGSPMVVFLATLTAGTTYQFTMFTQNTSGTMNWGQAQQYWQVLQLC
jgi:hypothetical protein